MKERGLGREGRSERRGEKATWIHERKKRLADKVLTHGAMKGKAKRGDEGGGGGGDTYFIEILQTNIVEIIIHIHLRALSQPSTRPP